MDGCVHRSASSLQSWSRHLMVHLQLTSYLMHESTVGEEKVLEKHREIIGCWGTLYKCEQRNPHREKKAPKQRTGTAIQPKPHYPQARPAQGSSCWQNQARLPLRGLREGLQLLLLVLLDQFKPLRELLLTILDIFGSLSIFPLIQPFLYPRRLYEEL